MFLEPIFDLIFLTKLVCFWQKSTKTCWIKQPLIFEISTCVFNSTQPQTQNHKPALSKQKNQLPQQILLGFLNKLHGPSPLVQIINQAQPTSPTCGIHPGWLGSLRISCGLILWINSVDFRVPVGVGYSSDPMWRSAPRLRLVFGGWWWWFRLGF